MLGGLVLLPSCGDHGSGVLGGTAVVRVMLTDSPSELLQSAVVDISHVFLVPSLEDPSDSIAIDLLREEDAPKTYDLFDLRNGIEALLAESPVSPGLYSQLRLVVEQAVVTLAEGLSFEDGSTSRTLAIPSGMETGIKVGLSEPIEAEDGTLTIVVVDFDVDANFKIQGAATTPSGIKDVVFTPVLVELSRAQGI